MTQKQKSDIQLFYARIIDRAAKLGFLLLLLTFSVYIGGILTPYVPLEHLPQYWGVAAPEYLKATQIRPGWGWLAALPHGDMLNFFPIAILAGVSIFGYLCLVYKFFRNREVIWGMIVIFQVLVLILAASGFLKTGGH